MRPGTRTAQESAAHPLELASVSKVYGSGPTKVTALDNVTLTLRRGTFTAIMGPSGSGKSTLLNCASGLDRPTSGKVFIDGDELPFRSERALTKFRRGRVELIFQQYNLLPNLTVAQNVTLPSMLAGKKVDPRLVRAVLESVGLADRRDARPAELSGGQQQRVAIARSLVSGPKLLFADEPTGALDSRTADGILYLLRETVRTTGRTVVMVTHDPVAAAHCDTVLFLADGAVVGELVRPTAQQLATRMTGLAERAGAQPAETQVR